jgi:uncharacterized protein (DUF3820 family)
MDDYNLDLDAMKADWQRVTRQDDFPTNLPFGKYKHLELTSVPTYYLEWCLETVVLTPRLKEAIRNALQLKHRMKTFLA